MRTYTLLLSFLLLFCYSAKADITINGAVFNIESNTAVNAGGSMEADGASAISNSGTVKVEENWVNNGTQNVDGTVVFSGNATLSGTTDFNDVVIEGGLVTVSTGTHLITNALFMQGGTVVNTGGALEYDANASLIYNGTTATTATAEWPSYGAASNPGAIRINNAAGVNLTSPKQVLYELFLDQGILTSNGNLTIASTPTRTGRIDGSGTGNVNGNFTMERYVSSGTGYRHFHSPVNSGFTAADLNDNISLQNLGGNVNDANNFPNLFYYDENNPSLDVFQGWNSFNALSDVINPGVGVTLYMAGNTVVDIEGTYDHSAANRTYTVTHSSNGVAHDGFNLIGNGHPSAIDWEQSVLTNVDATVNYWQDDLTGVGSGQYAYYQKGGISVNGGSQYIPSMQGVFVRVSSPGSGTVTMSNSHRTNQDPAFQRQLGLPNNTLKILVDATNAHDETVVRFDPNATSAGTDADYDAMKLRTDNGMETLIYTTYNGSDFAINGLPTITEDVIVPVVVEHHTAATFELTFDGITGFAPMQQVFLEDLKNGTVYDIRSLTTYTFDVLAHDTTARFHLRFTPPLEVESTSTTCSGNDGVINLNQAGSAVWDVYVQDDEGNEVDTLLSFNGIFSLVGLEGGTYTINVVNSYGYSINQNIVVNEIPAIVADFSVSTQNSEVGEPIDFSDFTEKATGNFWDFGDGSTMSDETTTTYTYTNPGTYTVTLTSSNDYCDDTQSLEITVNAKTTVGIDVPLQSAIKIGHDGGQLLHVQYENINELAEVSIIDMVGKTLLQKKGINTLVGSHSISLNGLASGYYVVQITASGSQKSQKIFISQ